MTTTSDIQQILDQHPQLHFDGYGRRTGETLERFRVELLIPESVEIINLVVDWLKANITPTHTINVRHSSYGLKHLAERVIGEYVGNGQLIVAALLCGYKMRTTGYNPCFAMGNRSIRAAYKVHNTIYPSTRPARAPIAAALQAEEERLASIFD
jgi:hypothetical protein